MAKVSIPREQIVTGSLPSICVVCGAEASHRRFPGVAAPSLAWILVSPLLGLVAFWTYILFAGKDSGKAGLPFCDRHRNYWTRRAWIIVLGFVVLVALITMAILIAPPEAAGQQPAGRQNPPHWLFGVLGCWMLLFLPTFLVVQLSAMRPTGGNRQVLVLSGVHRHFAAAVTSESG
jgi:hypothetical protein